MGGPLEKRAPGQQFKMFATEMNDFIDGVKRDKQSELNFLEQNRTINTNTGVAFAKNLSGEPIKQYEAVVVVGIKYLPDSSGGDAGVLKREEDAYKAQVVLEVDRFDEENEDHVGKAIVITLAPMDSGGVAKVMLSGTVQSKINVVDEDHLFCSVKTGSFTLDTSAGGTFEIIIKENGTGERWSYLRFPISTDVQQFKVKSLDQADSITCRTWDGTTEGNVDIQVAMPFLLQKTPFDNNSRFDIDFSYSTFQKRLATLEAGDEQDQVILPIYLEDDVIFARRNILGGINTQDELTGKQLIWMDQNYDGRYWAEDVSED